MNKYGACGYSGPWQTPLVAQWIKTNRKQGVGLPIIAGSVYHREDVFTFYDVGANAVALGAVCLVRPWQVNKIIQKSEEYFSTYRKE